MRILPSRFNPVGGFADFWNEIRRPNPHRWPILGLSILPVALALYWGATGTTVYAEPERPTIEYITTLDPNRTDAEIAAENRANQEINELRKAEQARIAERKRDLYKALGAASGMDVEAIEAKAEAERKAEAARAEDGKAEVAAATRPGEGSPQ
ncbi:hypothetical protein [Porphyrobacter sp. YT40]|uniref:hypothetical protein n=1 Tax=Porphyrobacter sp. YT40 TaxID=2547601 RepID=UPI001144018B|nr:hypothetical protein [Porphyrobacter sp. YT40]QDH35964.1 hypothetical protein E2E27_17575 [Porphyrobacter sp. YT40]